MVNKWREKARKKVIGLGHVTCPYCTCSARQGGSLRAHIGPHGQNYDILQPRQLLECSMITRRPEGGVCAAAPCPGPTRGRVQLRALRRQRRGGVRALHHHPLRPEPRYACDARAAAGHAWDCHTYSSLVSSRFIL